MAMTPGPREETVKLVNKIAKVAGKKGKSLKAIAEALEISENAVRHALKIGMVKPLKKIVRLGEGRKDATYAAAS